MVRLSPIRSSSWFVANQNGRGIVSVTILWRLKTPNSRNADINAICVGVFTREIVEAGLRLFRKAIHNDPVADREINSPSERPNVANSFEKGLWMTVYTTISWNISFAT